MPCYALQREVHDMLKTSKLLVSLFALFSLAGCDSNEKPESQSQVAEPANDAEMRSVDVGQFFGINPFSCKGYCGDTAFGICWCDDQCSKYGDCCSDYKEECAAPQACGTRGAEPCAKGSYCDFPESNQCGRTDLGGTCKPLPKFCTREYKPVCGCNGQTYSNECIANRQGVSVEYTGPCESVEVECGGESTGVCKENEYCAYEPDGMCGWTDATSVCKPRPKACTKIYAPVCGCDSKTYANECLANAAGTGILKNEACDPEPARCGGKYGDTCNEDEGEYCNFDPLTQCGANGVNGLCAKSPEVCTEQYAPVCGCDGKTYGNDCYAASQGVSVAHKGSCEAPSKTKCASSNQCEYGEWCNTDPCLPCDAGPDGICPAVCFGYCEALPKPLKLCMGDKSCDEGQRCDTNVCLSGCGNEPGIICPAVCWGQCVPQSEQ